MTITSILAIAAAGLVATTPAAAQVADAQSVVVTTADLDLATTAGAARLERRVRGAAREICGTPNSRVLADVMRVAACMTAAQDSARAQITSRIAAAQSAHQLADLSGTLRR